VVSIITGTGHHSYSGVSSVRAEVERYLRGQGISFREGGMGDGRGGIFICTLE
jgi:hypothetical protein